MKNDIFDNDVIQMLTPKVEVNPSAEMREHILNRFDKRTVQHPIRKSWHYYLGGVVSAAAIVAIVVTTMFTTPSYAARRYFESAIAAIEQITTMHLQMVARTKLTEDFTYINPEEEFHPITIKVAYGKPDIWGVEKSGGRYMLCDGESVYNWLAKSQSCTAISAKDALDPELASFIDTKRLLTYEREMARHIEGASYSIDEGASEVVVKITMPAQGNFSQSQYMRNTSIAESNSIREYTFDKQSGVLTAFRIDILTADNTPVTVLKSTRIAYNEPLDIDALVSVERPAKVVEAASAQADSPLVGISAEEAARLILEGISSWDKQIIELNFYSISKKSLQKVRDRYEGMRILSIGEAFSSGLYPGVFINCRIEFADGKQEDIRLAIRNDNPQRAWVFDGGL